MSQLQAKRRSSVYRSIVCTAQGPTTPPPAPRSTDRLCLAICITYQDTSRLFPYYSVAKLRTFPLVHEATHLARTPHEHPRSIKARQSATSPHEYSRCKRADLLGIRATKLRHSLYAFPPCAWPFRCWSHPTPR